MMNAPAPSLRCTECGALRVLLGDGEELCPACLLSLSLMPEMSGQVDGMAGQEDCLRCGPYLLGEVLGLGASGIVYQARREGTGREVALKRLAAGSLPGPEEWRRFQFEMEACAALDHPHIVKVLDLGEDSGVPYYVMEMAAGTLADEVRRYGNREGVADAVRLMSKVARAVHYAHEHGVLHRDLKPANILVLDSGEPKVADFGAGRALHAAAGLTMTGAAVGTPAYMAPEQASGLTLTTSADQFSLGAIFYHLLTGHPPFEGRGVMEVLNKLVSEEPADPGVSAPWLDRDLVMICLTALRKEPSRRYVSVAALADDLDRWLDGRPVLARPLSPWAQWVRWGQRHPLLAGVLITGVTALGVVAGIYVAGAEMLKVERDRALGHEREARAAALEAARVRDESRLNAYAADLYVGFHALSQGHLGKAREMLGKQVPANGTTDLRGFEWRALEQLCRGQDVKAWRDHQGPVTAVAFHPSSPLLASGGRDGAIVVREWPSGRETLRLPRKDAPRDLAEIPLLASIAARSADFADLMMDGGNNIDDLRMRSRPSKLGEIHALAWSADGRWLASGGGGSYVRVWAYPEGRLVAVVPVVMAAELAFSADATRLAIFSPSEGARHRFDLRIYETHRFSPAWSMSGLRMARAISVRRGWVAVSPADGREIEIRDFQSGRTIRKWPSSGSPERLTLGRGDTLLFVGDESGFGGEAWAVDQGKTEFRFRVREGAIDCLLGLPNGEELVWTGLGQSILLGKVRRDPVETRKLMGHEDQILALAASPDGSWLASGGNDHSLRLWRTDFPQTISTDPGLDFGTPAEPPQTGGKIIARGRGGWWMGDGARHGSLAFYPDEAPDQPRQAVRAPERYVRIVAAPDGTLAMLSWPRTIRILLPGNPEWRSGFPLTSGTVGPLIFSPDSRCMVSGGDDNRITIRATASGETIAELRGHQGPLVDLAFSHDGRTLASSSLDGTLRLWHVPTWRQIGMLHAGATLSHLEFAAGDEALRAKREDGGFVHFAAPRKKN